MSSGQLRFLESLLQEKQDIILELRSFNDQLCIGYEQSEHKVAMLNEQLLDYQKELHEKDDVIRKQSQNMEHQQDQIQNYKQEITHLQDMCRNYDQQINFASTSINNLKVEHAVEREELHTQLNQSEIEYKNLVQQLKKQQTMINQLNHDKEQFDLVLEKKFIDLQKSKEEEINYKLSQQRKRDQQTIQQLQDHIDQLQKQQKLYETSTNFAPSNTKVIKALKFSECVKNMVSTCIENKEINDLNLVWKLLKNILNEYSILKRDQQITD